MGAERAVPGVVDSPGASEVGAILSARAGENGAINQAYKTTCGGDPS